MGKQRKRNEVLVNKVKNKKDNEERVKNDREGKGKKCRNREEIKE